jgi:hypothetical protein
LNGPRARKPLPPKYAKRKRAIIGQTISEKETVVPTRAPEKGHKNDDQIDDFVSLQVLKKPAKTAELRALPARFINPYQ